MTERLYYDDAYTTEFTARIVERVPGERPAVVLDRTYFYPTGGGQPNDTGVIGGVPVIDVLTRAADGAVLHVLAGAPPAGDEVECRVDWERRFDFMQQHTGQHILTQAFVEVAGAQTVAFHLSGDTVTIDLDRAGFDAGTLAAVEDAANRVIFEDRPVTVRLIDPDAAEGVRVRRAPGDLHTAGLRVIEVQDFDVTACGGTHVARAGQIGLIKLIKVENHREGSRVEFKCGWRALRDYRERHAVLDTLATGLTVGYWETPEAVERLRAELKDTRGQLRAAASRLAEVEVSELLAAAEAREGVRLVRAVFEERDPGDVRSLVSQLVSEPRVMVLAGIPGDKAQIILARSADLPFDLRGALEPALDALGGGRGGGRPDFCQGGGLAADAGQVGEALQAAERVLFPARR